MQALPHEAPVEIPLSEAERIAAAYRRAAGGDAGAALVRAIEDALTDLHAAEQRVAAQGRLISRGYARCRVGAA